MIIAQLSDIHADGSGDALERLEAVVDWLRPLRPDALIVSGDLAEAEHQKSYREVRQRLERAGAPFFVVPGNVDDHRPMLEAFGEPLRQVTQAGTTACLTAPGFAQQ